MCLVGFISLQLSSSLRLSLLRKSGRVERGFALNNKKIGKRQRPKLAIHHEELLAENVWNSDGYIERVCVNGGMISGSDDMRWSFDDVVFKNVIFIGEFRAAEFVDVLFETCDFSNVHFQNASFYRCEVMDSKLTGADFANANLSHTLFETCDGKYGNFSFSRFKEVEFLNCNLTDNDFYECILKEIRFSTCKLDGINFAETDLGGVDLSTSRYEHIEVSLPKIVGCIVSKEQAIGFARILGLSIKEE